MTILDPAIKAKIIHALRFGAYRQIYGIAHREKTPGCPGGYCALGVICETLDLNPHDWPWDLGPFGFSKLVTLDTNKDTLVNTIWRMNDNHRWTFPKIADWLEQNT